MITWNTGDYLICPCGAPYAEVLDNVIQGGKVYASGLKALGQNKIERGVVAVCAHCNVPISSWTKLLVQRSQGTGGKCECGAEAAGVGGHSVWCPKSEAA